MRNIFVLGFFMMAIALCNGVSEGSGGDLVVITPTNNKSAPPTDSTDDSGSGDDDEDDDDDDGSATDAPTKMATTKMATTKMATTKMATTVTTTGTTTKATTKATTTIAATTRGGDDEDVAEGSGASGSGFVSTTAATKSEPVTDDTDIYISEGTTTKPKLHSTVKTTTTDSQSLPKTSSTDSIVVYDTTTTTTKTPVSKAQSTTAAVSTTASQDVSTRRATTKPTTPLATTPLATTQSTTRNSNVVGNTLKIPTRRKSNPSSILVHHTTETPTKKIIIDPKAPTGTTQKVKEPSTTAKDVDALALNQKKSGEGFTLTTEVIAGVVGCALLALLFIAFLMYRLKKRDEGSYLLDDSCGHPDAYKKVDNSDKEAFV